MDGGEAGGVVECAVGSCLGGVEGLGEEGGELTGPVPRVAEAEHRAIRCKGLRRKREDGMGGGGADTVAERRIATASSVVVRMVGVEA